MENQHIKIEVAEGTNEVIVRNGSALPLKEERKVNITGTIVAPAEYYKKRKDKIDVKNAHVLYSYIGMFVTLNVREDSEYQTSINGKLKMNPDLEKFGVNAGKMFTKNELKQFLKMNRAHFSDVDENIKIVTNLEKFSASVQTQIDDHASDRGDKKKSLEVKVDSNIDLCFNLSMPIFTGGGNTKFKVDICFDVRDNAISIWLESPELQNAIVTSRAEIIEMAIEPFLESFVVIEQ